jgi:hypothetical protein
MHKNRQNLKGRHFGHLFVTEAAPDIVTPSGKTDSRWHCICNACGQAAIRRSRVLLRGDDDQSCGCIATKALIERSTTHDLTSHPLYGTWRSMRRRCNEPDHHAYKNYGARGIKVCQRWENSFASFVADVGVPPFGMTLDRIENDGDYEPGNCRWATSQTQRRNSRQPVWVMLHGKRLTLTEAATELGTNRGNLRLFARQHDLDIQQAVEQWKRQRNRFIFRKS